jgi:putative inorganic carbon (HCO3(-)) transporter
LLVEAGVPGLLAGLAVLVTAVRSGLRLGRGEGRLALPALAAVAVFAGLAVQGLTDTIFFRPEVQLVALFSLATLAAAAADPLQQPLRPGAGLDGAEGSGSAA